VSKPLLTEEEADQELEDAVRWYEERRSGLGAELLAAIDASLLQITGTPGSGSPVPRVRVPVRRVPVQGFPYHVVYLDTASAIRVLAFAHTRRRPGYWLPRLKRS
jgi:plasmid stabilization system protein ParE